MSERNSWAGFCNRREFIASTALLVYSKNSALASGKTAPVRIPHAVIRMSSPNSALFGITPDPVVEITYAEVLNVHGYCAGGAAFAFRMAQEAFKALYGDGLPVRQGIKVATSHHCCQAGALAHITGARTNYGAFRSQGDLVLLPVEEKKTVFTDKASGRAVTLGMRFNPHDTFEPLFKKAIANLEFAPQVHEALNAKISEYLTAPAEKLFTISVTAR